MPTSVAARARVARPQISPASKPRATPFLKWVGGKGRLSPTLTGLLPPGVGHMRHVEPFMGGGALFFARQPGRALLCDVNEDLVRTFVAVRDQVADVIRHLSRLSGGHGKEQFYEVRETFNEKKKSSNAQRAAQFIYLNKTCFNGLYRVNRKGAFNVPMGSYKKPAILDSATLLSASDALADAEIKHAPFESLLRDVHPGDFVYLDPPYEPLSRTANFTSYARDGFSQDDQRRLRDVYRELDRRGAKLMLSNSDVPFIRELYRGFDVTQVMAPRAVSCDGNGRGPVAELVIRNYA